MLLGCLSQTHASFLPSALCYQMACFAFSNGSLWAALSPRLQEAQHHTELYHTHSHDLHPTCKMLFTALALNCDSYAKTFGQFLFFVCLFLHINQSGFYEFYEWKVRACLYKFPAIKDREKSLENVFNLHQFDTSYHNACWDFTWQNLKVGKLWFICIFPKSKNIMNAS